MRGRLVPVLSVCLFGAVAACAPTFNWRELPIGSTALTALFPCKPERVSRTLSLAQSQRTMVMRSCVTGGVTFAIAHADLPDPAQATAVLADWRASTLAGLRADPASVRSEPPSGLPVLPQMQVLRAARAGGEMPPLFLTGVWFAKGRDVFAAFVMAPVIPAEAADPFFAGLRLR